MFLRCLSRLFVLLAVLLCALSALAQTPPKDLAQWQLICFCSSGNPDAVVRYDNNGQILFLARGGVTREQLKQAGVPFTESQLQLMKDWRLLAEHQGQLKTLMPVLGPEQMTRLRSFLQAPATGLGRSLRPSFEEYLAILKGRGYSHSAYAIVFSYVLDGLVWDEFDRRHLLPSMTVTVDKPLWAGALWAVYPKQNVPGTNSRSKGISQIDIMWHETVLNLLDPLNHPKVVDPVLEELGKSGVVTSPAPRDQLIALGVLDSEGKPLVPVIHEAPSDPVYISSLAISSKVSEGMLRAMQSPELHVALDVADEPVALVIAYHESMWQLLAYLESEDLVAPPPILSASSADPKQVRRLVFFVVSPPK